jgi:hypothetical protein|nr:MAG TPA: Transcription initiation factor TFIID subunit, DNA, Nuclear [Caudoviricetes sp.]
MKLEKRMDMRFFLNLALFGGDGGGAGSGAGASAGAEGGASTPEMDGKQGGNPLAAVRYGKQADGASPAAEGSPAADSETSVTSDTALDKRAAFDELIKGEYKDVFAERTQQIINARFKQTKALEEQAERLKTLSPVLDMIASRYGVDASDAEALAKAIEEDDSYYEAEASEKGLTVEQLKHMKRMERENAAFKRAAEEAQRRRQAEQTLAIWNQQAEDCKRFYGNFDLAEECSNPGTGQRFLGLLQSGIDVKTAYEVIHKDDIIGGAMQYTAQAIQKKTVDDIRARGMRPAENGGGGNAAAIITKKDVNSLTKKDREEISRRVMRGERIEF